MRALLPHDLDDPTDSESLFHAYRAPQRSWIRSNFVASADGGASVEGTAGGLGSPADQAVLAILRAHAEVVVVGAGTVRAEGYGPLQYTPERTALRAELGFTGPARLAVVTGHPDFTGAERWIAQAPVPPIVLTTPQAAHAIPGAEVVGCGESDATWVSAEGIVAALHERDLRAILCEGGPHLHSELASAGYLDELCLTISPLLVGPGSPRIVAGPPWTRTRPSHLTQLLEDDSLLFARYALD